MTLTKLQREALDHLEQTYIGPEGGPAEILDKRPDLHYAVGMLFPSEAPKSDDDEGVGLIDDVEFVQATSLKDDDNPVDAVAEDWRPSSVAVSLVTDAPSVLCTFDFAVYQQLSDTDEGQTPRQWQRLPLGERSVELPMSTEDIEVELNGAYAQVGSRWRPFGDAYIVTVHLRNCTDGAETASENLPRTLFQVGLSVQAGAGGEIRPYQTAPAAVADAESEELQLRYRNRRVFGVGHGLSADWDVEDGRCRRVYLTALPHYVVESATTDVQSENAEVGRALSLTFLETIDDAPEAVCSALDAFVADFDAWVAKQDLEAVDLARSYGDAIVTRLTDRGHRAVARMREGITLLREEPLSRTAFALAMTAMRTQMNQQRIAAGRSQTLAPAWRPFQLGFLLTSLASTFDENHDDRELVDLIWFPTGGGKTEAYLGLAAFEIFKRRLQANIKGAGTAVITRYTLRLLTSQQFQRTAALVCAMEVMRREDSRVSGMSPFSIGLWVGGTTTPNTGKEAKRVYDDVLRAESPREKNKFQVETCPWCLEYILPERKKQDRIHYGLKIAGDDVRLRCVNRSCAFNEELPMLVVDDQIFEQQPTILLATVDKFANMQFDSRVSRLLGVDGSVHQPSLIIQDELHLLSGPLGTTVGVFEAVIQVLLTRNGRSPKYIASTATIRSSDEQVRGLYGREVALYPPAGLSEEDSYFSRPDNSGEGRLYVGLMPQSFPQTTALIMTASPLLELPRVLQEVGADDDAYWTLVMYFNSLRELGRSNTDVIDDVKQRLSARAEREGVEPRVLTAERVVELTSRKKAEELRAVLDALGKRVGEQGAIDVVLSSNMLSVGIDVSRLALMMVVGQPKTNAEYIQATSRVGRDKTRGVIVNLYRSSRARDRSYFETFRGFHESLYRNVEPTSVTPWSMSSRERSLRGAVTALLRQALPILEGNTDAANLNLGNEWIQADVDELLDELRLLIRRADAAEVNAAAAQMRSVVNDWNVRRADAEESNERLVFQAKSKEGEVALLRRFGEAGDAWEVGNSMRSVESPVRVVVREPWGGQQ